MPSALLDMLVFVSSTYKGSFSYLFSSLVGVHFRHKCGQQSLDVPVSTIHYSLFLYIIYVPVCMCILYYIFIFWKIFEGFLFIFSVHNLCNVYICFSINAVRLTPISMQVYDIM